MTEAVEVKEISVEEALYALNVVKSLVLRKTENLPTDMMRSNALIVLDAVESWIVKRNSDNHEDSVTVVLAKKGM